VLLKHLKEYKYCEHLFLLMRRSSFHKWVCINYYVDVTKYRGQHHLLLIIHSIMTKPY